MASAIFISTILPSMAAKAMDIINDNGLAIGRYKADKAVDKAVDKVTDKPMDKVMAMVLDKVDGIINIERDIFKLQTTLYMIQSIVRVAEEKQIDDDFIQNWLRDLVDIGYEARDVLDDFITFSSSIITAEEASNPVNFISSLTPSYFGSSSSDTSQQRKPRFRIPLAILNRLAKDIRSVRERFDETFRNLRSVGGRGSESVREYRRPEVGPFINKQRDGLLLGRGEVKKGIMEKILHPSDVNCVHVVAIWGMGGIGKTTLAQSIYNDKRVKEVPRSWLCVGENKFSAKEIITKIINDSSTTNDVESLRKKLVEKFRDNRFLIVLDDVWDVDGSEWNLLFNPLTDVGKGGLIIITTRRREVCPELINIQTPYNLEVLSEQDSWSIFESCAYVNGKADRTPDLKHTGKDIVKKLKGLPLALKVVGRSLLNKDSSTWTNFLESKLTRDDEVMSALIWSYNHLPPHLKMCFTYCALFPKGHEFDKNVLVEMWMAHDLIQKEDVRAQYFEELVNDSLLQCVDGKYVMHDLIHDLALHVSNGEFATANGSLSIDQMKKVRHLTIGPGDYSKIPRLCNIEKLLTLYTICSDEYTNWFDDSVLDDVFKQLKSIRVLVLSSEWIYEIPDCISELKHLRYLDVTRTSVKSLPDSLDRLYNLQMIAAPNDSINRVKLPIDIVNISSLRYIRANLSTCKGVGKLTSLQELSSIHVCKEDNIRELGDMQRLRGKLRIEGLGNVEKLEDDVGSLMEKQLLMDELELIFNQHYEEPTISAQVLDTLGCPPNLTYLQIYGYTGINSPSWMVDGKHKFDKLQTLELFECPKLESFPPLGELTSLKRLSLWNVGVKRLGDEFYGKFTDGKVFFPSLESLYFYDMEEWEEWDDIIIENSSVSFFPRLTRLEIHRCPKLLKVLPVAKEREDDEHPIMTSLSRLEIWNCHVLKQLQLDALVSLKHLDISDCSSLIQITSAICLATTIEILKISQCEDIEKMDFERLPSLKHLDVNCCNKLISIPCLVGIKYLNLYGCESLRSLSINIHGLDSLEHLHINGCPTLELELPFEDESSSSSSSGNSIAVPTHSSISTDNTQVFRKLLHHEIVSLESLSIRKLEGFENFGETEANNFCKFRSLKTLEINDCPKLQSLPSDFHKLSSLEELYIICCPQLQSLPADGFPPSLTDLRITKCPLLYERCKNVLDWHKIKHIRNRHICE